MTAPLLTVKGLDFDYPEQKLFSQLSFELLPGVTLLSGGGGSGKTTLLRLLAGEMKPRSGQVQMGDVLLVDPATYQRQVFWADPRSGAFDALDQTSPTDYFHSLQAKYPRFAGHLLDGLIDGLNLEEHVRKPFYMLSTGSKRKVLLAAAFASGAPLTLLDEPFAALDKPSINFVMGLLDEAAANADRAWLVAHYDLPCSAPVAGIIDLGG
jgi:ABC-type multidrug transport system ATPase subunit